MTSRKLNSKGDFLLSLGSLLFIISSGFSSYIRFFGIILIFTAFIKNIILNKAKFSLINLLFVSLIVLCYFIGVVNNLLSHAKTTEIFILTSVLIFAFPLFVIIFGSFNKDVIDSVLIFVSKSLIVLFFTAFVFLNLVYNSVGPILVKAAQEYTGYLYFYYRPLGVFENYPLLWTQASIFPLPLAIWFLFKNNFKLFLSLSFVVFLSLNRTGSTIIIIFFLIKVLKINLETLASFFSRLITILPLFFLIVIVFLFFIYSGNFKSEYSGFDIRLGHVLSVVNNLKGNFVWVFGMGADSEFVSIGWEGDGITRDQEISYLEILRRFGIIGFSFFNVAIILIFYNFLRKKNWPAFFSFFTYILFSFTNPCLISLLFVLYLSLILSSSKGIINSVL